MLKQARAGCSAQEVIIAQKVDTQDAMVASPLWKECAVRAVQALLGFETYLPYVCLTHKVILYVVFLVLLDPHWWL